MQAIHALIELSLVFLERKNKAKNARIMQAARGQLETLVRLLRVLSPDLVHGLSIILHSCRRARDNWRRCGMDCT
jgi:hypothetical protein